MLSLYFSAAYKTNMAGYIHNQDIRIYADACVRFRACHMFEGRVICLKGVSYV